MTTFRHKLLTSTLLGAAAIIALPANAQTAGAPPVSTEPSSEATGQDDTGEAIVITGSRIPRRDLTSTSPLAVVGQEEFQLTGAINVEQVLNTLPQVLPGTTAYSNNPGGGVSTLNLRGLGATRTLTLVNGRRYMYYGTDQVTDANTIPAFLIEGVDVVTGGASAVYGSDAIAGVVNFRLRQDLSGIIAGTQYGITERGDGQRFNAYVAVGSETSDGRGRVTAYGEYYTRSSIFQDARDFSERALGEQSLSSQTIIPLGSSATPQGILSAAGTVAVGPGASCGGATGPRNAGCFSLAEGTNFAGNGGFFSTPGASRPYNPATDSYNYAVDNYLMVPQERWLLGGYGEYEITPGFTAYTEVAFAHNRVENELAPTPVTGTFAINLASNAQYLSAADRAALSLIDQREATINAARAANGQAPLFSPTGTAAAANQLGTVGLSVSRRINETGSRNASDERNTFRALVGIRGDITETINYDASYFYSRNRLSQVQTGNISRSAFARLLQNGQLNIFGAGQLTPAQVAAISITSQNSVVSELEVATASVAGTLFNLGTGAGDIGFAVGGEYRRMGSEFIPDTALSSGDVIGFNAGLPTAGSYNVKEVFGELRIPIIEDGFIHRLEVTGAARYSDYSLAAVGGVWTYAGGAQLAPIPDITFRGEYQRAVRAPNVGNLFGGRSIGFPGATDPCAVAANATNTVIRDLCIATGVPASQVGSGSALQPNPQIQGTFGGNDQLREEVSDTYTVGVVLRPSFIPRLAVTVDAYDITVNGSISTLGGGLDNTLNLCYNVVQDINSIYCQAIRRNPNDGRFDADFQPLILNANIGQLATRGIDVQVDYSQPLGFSLTGAGESRLQFFYLGTYTDQFDITPVQDLPDIVNECAGRFGQTACGDPVPTYKHTARLSFLDGPSTISLRWRYLGAVRDDNPNRVFGVERISPYSQFDLAASFTANDNLTFSAGVNNLLDKQPPILGSNQQQANTYPGTYDPLGRDYFVSARLEF